MKQDIQMNYSCLSVKLSLFFCLPSTSLDNCRQFVVQNDLRHID